MVKINGNDFPDNLFYHREHMWVKVENGKVRVGYNDWAQEAAGKLVSIKTRPIGRSVKQGKTLGSVESGKWVGPLRTPVSGNISELNEKVLGKPDTMNEDPYGEGWIAVIEPDNLDTEIEELISGKDIETLRTWLNNEKTKHQV
jgi:glycine cleavage system H protein